MTSRYVNRFALAALLAVSCVVCTATSAAAQDAAVQTPQAADARAARERVGVNFEVRLHLLTASPGEGNSDARASRLPQELQSIVKQLRASLPFANYALGTTFINRVRDGGNLQFKAVTTELSPGSSNSNPANPQFYEFILSPIRLNQDAQGNEAIQIETFRFGGRVPVQTGSRGSDSPVINYEPTGLTTSISVREDVPVVVGMLPTANTDAFTVVVLHIKRADAR